jgi:hypothetical protein
MTLDNKRWAQLASELKFSQLDTARKQAEVWRAGLAALTALLTAILVLKDSVGECHFRAVRPSLLSCAT